MNFEAATMILVHELTILEALRSNNQTHPRPLTSLSFEAVIQKDNWSHVQFELWHFEWLKWLCAILVCFNPCQIGIHCLTLSYIVHSIYWYVKITHLVMCSLHFKISEDWKILQTISIHDNSSKSVDMPPLRPPHLDLIILYRPPTPL